VGWHGVEYPITLRINSTDVPTFRKVFINREYAFEIDRPPKSIIDAGANIGLATIYFANRFPEAQIISIEPEVSNFQLLNDNVANYKQVKTLQAALWKDNSQISLFDPGLGEWGFQTVFTGQLDFVRQHHVVQAYTVDRLMADHNLEFVDIFKIDIEGAEKEVFEEPSRWIHRVGILIVELHEHIKIGCNRSFYNATNDFVIEKLLGENVFLSK
jgi:FkbM family methyltransferase